MKKIVFGTFLIALAGSTTAFAQGAATGAATGAVGGAIVGGPAGAAVGATVGAVAGGIADEFASALSHLCRRSAPYLLSIRP